MRPSYVSKLFISCSTLASFIQSAGILKKKKRLVQITGNNNGINNNTVRYMKTGQKLKLNRTISSDFYSPPSPIRYILHSVQIANTNNRQCIIANTPISS